MAIPIPRRFAMTDPQALQLSLHFDGFEFIPASRRLERDGEVVELSSRALDILAALTARPGEVISKRELLELAWPGMAVVEAALRYHMVGLRRALRDGEGGRRLIVTVPGRGYCFVGALESAQVPDAGRAPDRREALQAFPARPVNVVGRDAVAEDLLHQLELHRFVTVVGPGGIGKTTVALMVAHDWVSAHEGVAAFVDLGELGTDGGEGLPEALCAKLGLVSGDVSPTDGLIAHLRTREALILLDTCEGAIDAAAHLAELLVASASGVRVLATSREALRAEGERVNRIESLAVPSAGQDLTAREALKYPAVQLFVQRVAASHSGFELTDQQAGAVAAICSALEGVALAIELAAGRVEAFGIQKVADLLATEFALTWPGRRTATPRQQTLNATLNWSHGLLSSIERVVFRRLSLMVGAYTLEAAVAVCAGELAAAEVVDTLAALIAKSLLSAVAGPTNRFRMLDTTRAFALTRLAESGDERATRARHAEYYLGRLTASGANQDEPGAVSEETANVSATLGWAFGEGGDSSIGVRLTGAATALWIRNGLVAECRRWARVVQARSAGDLAPSDLQTRLILANALMVTDGMGGERRLEMEAAYASALKQGQLDERVMGLSIVWADVHRRCRYAEADRLLDEAGFLKTPNATHMHRLTALWMRGMTDHCAGRQERACEHLKQLLSEYTEDSGRQFLHQLGYDLEAAAATILGMSEFLRGDLDNAYAANDRAIAKARTLSNTVSLGAVLRWRAMMTYCLDEDALEVDRPTREFLPTGTVRDEDPPDGTVIAVQGLWLARRGQCVQGAEMVRQALRGFADTDYLTIQSFVRAEIALQLLRHGAGDLIGEFLAPLENDDEEDGWATPEVLRVRGEIAERRGDLALAEARYREALDLAERQEALTWRLRAAISLADLWLAQNRADDAAAMLAPIRGRFRATANWPLLRRADDRLSSFRAASGSVS